MKSGLFSYKQTSITAPTRVLSSMLIYLIIDCEISLIVYFLGDRRVFFFNHSASTKGSEKQLGMFEMHHLLSFLVVFTFMGSKSSRVARAQTGLSKLDQNQPGSRR